ncbi:hypothetical protein F4777DRAFT_571230 [Nemania sp. FL0916]|nr:hypothetical protein F4777DRAFT_571230 [Nemania sp. FL0916]
MDPRDREIQERWAKGIDERLELPPKSFPIVIKAGTIVSSPEDLQKLLNLESTPQTFTSETTSLELPGEYNIPSTDPVIEVVYCVVSWEQLKDIEKQGWAEEEIVIWYQGIKRFAKIVLPPKVKAS